MERISVIVAVYNQEKYLHKCIDSLLNQTYKNLEVILINDESKDASGEIIDNYAKMDSRVKVFHQKNAGLAEVRNRGIREATGEYIGFVDGDDWVEPEMFESLLKVCKENEADIGSCQFNIYNESYELIKEAKGGDPQEVFTSLEAIRKTYDESGFTSFNVWNKLYRKEMFSGLKFPDRYYEDEAILSFLYGKANKVAVVWKPLYNHYSRESGISKSMLNRFSEKKLDILENYVETYTYLDKHYPEACELVTRKHFFTCIDILMHIIKDKENREENNRYVELLGRHLNTILDHLKNNSQLTAKQRLMARVLAKYPRTGMKYYQLNPRLRLKGMAF